MEAKKHSRVIDPRKKGQVDSFIHYLVETIFHYRDACDIFVSIKSENGDCVILEELDVSECYMEDVLHHCLFVSPPSFRIACKIRAILR